MFRKVKDRLLRFTDEEDAELVRRAEVERVTVSTLLRKGVGLPPLERGGAREGAGRPTKRVRAGRSKTS